MSPVSAVAAPPAPGLAAGFWPHFVHEVGEHHVALWLVAAFLTCLVAAARFLPPGKRGRVGFPLAAFLLYLTRVPGHALFGDADATPWVRYFDVAGELLFSYGVVALAATLLFDVAARRVSRVWILRDVFTIGAGAVATVALLSRAGFNLLSLVTTSAVLTAVVGLALQDTLGNMISGVAIQLESTLSPGDWVTINDIAGQVSEIRWRSVVIVTRNDDMVVLPHAMISKAVITNHSRPVGWQRRWVHFFVHYRHPPNEVEHVVLASLAGTPNVKHEDPPPDCILLKMEQDHAHFAVRYRLLDLRRDDFTDGEVRKRIWYALRRHGIEIPYPSRNVFVTQLDDKREERKSNKERDRRIAALRPVDLFHALSDEEIAHLADRLRVELFGAGEVVIRQGAEGDSLHLINRGEVAIRFHNNDRDQDVAVLGRGEFFGEMSLMTGDTRHATVIARDDVECYVIDRALFKELVSRRQGVVEEVGRVLAARQTALCAAEAAGGDGTHLPDHESRLVARIKSFFGIGS